MASNNDLDDFFKKKDRKSNKSKKPTTSSMLTNNEELLKQLVIVTSATIAFKENMISDDEDDDNQQQPINDNSIVKTGPTEDTHKHHKTKVPDKNKNSNDQYINISSKTDGQQQQEQDQWEEFEASNYKYEEVRSKLEGSNIKEDNDDYDDENNRNNNDNIPGDREQQKDRRVWKTNSVKEEEKQIEPVVEQKIEEPKPAPTSSGAYRPPQLRSGASVTVVSSGNVNPRPAKKKEPNLASTDEFPTLGATVNKK